MRLSTTTILYTPPACSVSGCESTRGKMALVNYPGDNWRFEDRYFGSTGACYGYVQKMEPKEQTRWIFNQALHLIVRDGMDPQVVHNTLCEIREYRDGLAPDMPVPEHLRRKFNAELAEDG